MGKTKIDRQRVSLTGQGSTQIQRAKKPKLGGKTAAPNFRSLFTPEGGPNPLDGLPDGGGIEENVENELSEALRLILEEKRQLRDMYRVQNDANYYAVLVFQSEGQKGRFLALTGWGHPDDKFINGLQVAEKIGVDIEPVFVPRSNIRKMPKALRDHIMKEN
jgi:hypothetical protein